MHKYTSKTYDYSLPIAYIALGMAPFILVIILLRVIEMSKTRLVGAILLSFITVSILSSILSWRELKIGDDEITYLFIIKPFRIINTVISWDIVKQVELYPCATPMGPDWNAFKGLEPERKLLRLLGEGNKRLLSTNITDFGQDAEIRKIIEDICERKGIPCRQMWKEWGKKKQALGRK